MSAAAALTSGALSIHASTVLIGEHAVVLRGASGAGKSALALSLIVEARRRRRFACLVADDRVRLTSAGGRLIVAPHPAIAGHVERRFVGIATMPHEARAVARLVVDLESDAPGIARLPDSGHGWTMLAGVRLRRLILPVSYAGAVDAILHTLLDSAE